MSYRQMAIHSTTPLSRFAERLYPLGYPVILETDDLQLASLVKTSWGGWPQMVSGDPLRVSVQCGKETAPFGHGSVKFRATPTGFRFDGAESAIFDAPSMHLQIRATDGLSGHFLNTVMLTALDYSLFSPIHAACVVRNGFGVVLSGDSGAGKSTLSYACARRGWTLVCDDSLHLHPSGLTVGSLSSTIYLREPARALFPELEQEHLGVAPNGKPAMTIVPAQRGLRTARTAPVERLLFLARRPGPPRLSLLDLDDVTDYLFKCLWQPDALTHQRRLRELAQRTQAARFEYGDIEEAVDALDELLKEEGVAA